MAEYKPNKPTKADSKRLKEATNKLYQAIAEDEGKPKISHLPKDWRSRILR